MSRNYNFCAGPAALPNEVLEQLKSEIPDWQGKGLSVMEMSHRSKEFVEIAETAKQDFIDLMEINTCLLYTSPSPRDGLLSRMPSSA